MRSKLLVRMNYVKDGMPSETTPKTTTFLVRDIWNVHHICRLDKGFFRTVSHDVTVNPIKAWRELEIG